MNKKGQMGGVSILVPLAITLVVLAIVLSLGQQILGDFGDSLTASSYEANATTFGQQGLDKVATKQGLIATVIVVGVLIAIVVGSFAFARRN